MPERLAIALVACLLALAAPVCAAADTDAAWVGAYEGLAGANGSLRIEPAPGEPGRLSLTWDGGGDDTAGAATAAGCHAEARGTPVDALHLRAELIPFKTADQELDAADLAALKPKPLELVRVAAPVAMLRVDGVFAHCGLQAALAGWYWRSASASADEAVPPGGERDCAAGTTAADAACLNALHRRQDGRLNREYQRLLARLSAPGRAVLRRAQRQWLAERDRLCAPPGADAQMRCLARATAHRADELAAIVAAIGPADASAVAPAVAPAATSANHSAAALPSN